MADGELYTKTKCGYWLDREFKGVSIGAETFWHRCRSVAKQLKTDGCLDERQMASTGIRGWRRLRDELVSSSLLEARGDDVFFLRGWMNWNKSKAQIDEEIQARREAGRIGGLRSGEVRKAKQLASGVLPENEANTQADPSSKTNPETETETETDSPPTPSRDVVRDIGEIRVQQLTSRYLAECDPDAVPPLGAVTKVIARWLAVLDYKLIDEAIGFCGDLDNAPRTAGYLDTVLHNWALDRGVVAS